MEKRESHNAETYLNIEALASGVQECRLAGVRSCGGGPYNQSAPTSLYPSPGVVWVQYPQAPQMALQSSSAASTRQVTWSDATTPATPDVAPSDHVQVVNPFGSKPLSQAVHNSVQST